MSISNDPNYKRSNRLANIGFGIIMVPLVILVIAMVGYMVYEAVIQNPKVTGIIVIVVLGWLGPAAYFIRKSEKVFDEELKAKWDR